MAAQTTAPREATLVDPAILLNEDPHAVFARFRRETPVIRTSEHRFMVLRARDVAAILRDTRTVQIEGADYARYNGVPEGRATRFLADFFLFSNGQDHRTGRGLFAASFSHGAIRGLRSEIRATAETITAEMPRGESFDFLAHAASRAPAEMIAAILGLPREEAPHFARLVYVVANLLVPVYPAEWHAEIETAAGELHDYVRLHLSRRIAAPQEDMLSRVVAAWRKTQAMSLDRLAHQVMGLIIGGSDTTRGAIAMTTALLLEHPDQWAALRADPSLIAGAVNEGLRFEPSIGSTVRLAAMPLMVDGVEIPAGQMIVLSTLSALRDPEAYPDPNRFDIRREGHPRDHLVFGGGVHRCIGEMLARAEIEEMIGAIARNAPEIALTRAPRLEGFGGIRRITPMETRIPA